MAQIGDYIVWQGGAEHKGVRGRGGGAGGWGEGGGGKGQGGGRRWKGVGGGGGGRVGKVQEAAGGDVPADYCQVRGGGGRGS